MGKFILEIDLGNDAMRNAIQLAVALLKVANRIGQTEYELDESIVRGIMDENGNSIGSWRIEP